MTRSRRSDEIELGDNDAGGRRVQRVLEVGAARARRGQRARADLPAHRRYTKLVELCCQGRDRRRPRREEGAAASRRRRSTRRCWRTPIARSTSTGRCSPSTRTIATAIDALERLYIRLERWEPLKDIYAKKAELAHDARREEADALRARAGLRPRAAGSGRAPIETYQTILDLDPEDFDARSRRSIASISRPERWYDLLPILEREVELAPSTGEAVSLKLPHRPAVARAPEGSRRAPSRPTATCWDGRHARADAAALDGLMQAAMQEPVLAAAGARADLRGAPASGSGSSTSRGDGRRTPRIRSRRSSCCTASPRSRSAACRTRTRRSRPTGARCTKTRPTRTCSRTSSGWRPRRGHWASWPRSTRPSWTRSTMPRRQVEMLLRLARVYEEETGQPEEAIADLPPRVEAEPRTRRRCSRSIGCTAAPSVGRAGRRSCAARSGSPPNDQEIVALTSAWRRSTSRRSGHAQGDRGLSRDPGRRPDARRDARRARAAVHGRHMQIEIADVLEPLYRAGEEWEKLPRSTRCSSAG